MQIIKLFTYTLSENKENIYTVFYLQYSRIYKTGLSISRAEISSARDVEW